MNRETLSLLKKLSGERKRDAASETARLGKRLEEGRRQEAMLSRYADNLAHRLLDAASEGCDASTLQGMQEFGDALEHALLGHTQTLSRLDHAFSGSLARLQAASISERMVTLLEDRQAAARIRREAKEQDRAAEMTAVHRSTAVGRR